MRNFQDTFETRKRSFISAFSIGMTVPLIGVHSIIFLPLPYIYVQIGVHSKKKTYLDITNFFPLFFLKKNMMQILSITSKLLLFQFRRDCVTLAVSRN